MGSKICKWLKEAGKVLEALTDLALKAGTLFAVIKMIYDSIQK